MRASFSYKCLLSIVFVMSIAQKSANATDDGFDFLIETNDELALVSNPPPPPQNPPAFTPILHGHYFLALTAKEAVTLPWYSGQDLMYQRGLNICKAKGYGSVYRVQAADTSVLPNLFLLYYESDGSLYGKEVRPYQGRIPTYIEFLNCR